MIAFSCQQCETHFKVSNKFAGKKARCKKCGNDLRVPGLPVAAASVAASGMFRMGAVTADQLSTPPASRKASMESAPSAAQTSPRLAPIPSLDDLQPIAQKRQQLQQQWEEEEAVEYELDKPIASAAATPAFPIPQTRRRIFWGRGGIAEVLLLTLRKFSDFAYLISIPFLLLMLIAIILRQRELAILAAAIVVLLNVVRLVTEGLVLLPLAFKNGPLHGVLFFIPPFTFYYLNNRGKVMKEALSRFLGAALPIVGVVLLFVFVPRLRGGDGNRDESLGEQLRSGTRAVQEQIKTHSSTPSDAKN